MTGRRGLEARLVETPISRGRAVLANYGVPFDILMWTGADPEAPGPKECLGFSGPSKKNV